MEPAEPNEVVDFGPFRLYARHRKLFCRSEEVHLGGRAMDVLLALARKKGELVTKEQLFEAAWPDVFVHESNLKVTVAYLRRALREFSPSHEYLTTVVGRGYWLGTDAPPEETGGKTDLPVAAAAPLPELGTVIGRDAEIAELREMLANNRLTTIVGAGGIGKTTVAVAVAQLFEDEGGGSVAFVDFARVASEEFVTSSLAAALGVSSNGDDRLQAIVSILARRKAVLLLDTCEHVLNAVAHICDVVLAQTPDIRILATSRQVLRARGEKVVWLAPLEVPPADHADTARDVLLYSAPQLLAARAFEKTGYRVEDKDARAIAEICRRLDGAPLAIELVSSRLAGRSAGTVLEELDDRFRTLRRDSPGGPLRQRTLLVTLEWSYALLTSDEAAVLRAISIFAGSFDTDAAVRVVAHLGLAPSATFDAIAGLSAKSMLSVDQTFGELRHRLLDSTRAFAGDLLDSQGELGAVSASHARLQLEILTRAGAEHATMPARRWHATYGGRADDLRKALDWALDHSGDPLLGIQLVAAGLPLWHELSLGEETRMNCERALIEFDRIDCADTALKLTLVLGLATVSTYLSDDPGKTVALFETAIQLARETADASAECRALGALSTFAVLTGHQSAVLETLQAMRDAAIRANDRPALWEQELLRAVWDVLDCKFQAGYQRLMKLCEEMRDHSEGAVPRFHIHQKTNMEVQRGALCWLIGKPGRALRVIEKAARDAMETGHGLTLTHALARGIIWTMHECHDYAMARFYTDHLKNTIDRHGMAAWIPIADCYSASIDALTGASPSSEGLRAAFDNLRRGSFQVGHHSYYAMLANAMVAIGQWDDATRTLDHVFQVYPERWILPEILRLRAATERAYGCDDDAMATLRQSLQAAGEIGCLAWKLRAAHDLASLLHDKGAPAEARRVLEPVYGQFTDGFNSGDLRNSRKLLEQLGWIHVGATIVAEDGNTRQSSHSDPPQ
ncbi:MULTISPECIES: winged helix-turn-helix domain-containing protein [unclassified Rhizobium]|uniref:ATP-binding protein n=1 Tax=unclassified Rhizobium TaxID=2613769 RepID=UPI0021F6DB90|nr:MULTISPECIES: winged helix-turn-helix domain-containing protein [unclassified Rhizobium]MCV9942158.1 winged helix-turn-helix domain-containing protein [Rhizobium sp. BT-175]MCW0015881.1 winged helix-turn-helix domain-containing protein [Rhizobium sp. BT-226]